MIVKLFEIRDAGTFIPALAIELAPDCGQDRYLLRRAGFSSCHRYIVLMSLLDPNRCEHDPVAWPASPRTMREAHRYIVSHWDELTRGDMIDVEFIKGESTAPKISERTV